MSLYEEIPTPIIIQGGGGGGGSGTVTSVTVATTGLTNLYTVVTGNPVTNSGTILLTASTTNATINTFWRGDGSWASPPAPSISGSGVTNQIAFWGAGTSALTGSSALQFVPTSAALLYNTYRLDPFEFNAGNSGTSATISWVNGSSQVLMMTSACSVLLNNGYPGGAYILRLTQGSTGNNQMGWPASVKWSGGTAPALTSSSAKNDLINFYYDGTTYYGSFTLNY